MASGRFSLFLILGVTLFSLQLPAQVSSVLQVNPGTPLPATLPLDVALKHTFTVRNNGTTDLIVDVRTRVVETNQEAPIFPQPPILYLSPQQEIPVTIILDGETGKLSQLPVGQHSRQVAFTFINHNNPADSLRIAISFAVNVLNRSNITGTLQVNGKVVDQTGAPVADAQVNLETGTDFSLPNGTGTSGGFSYSVPAHSKWMLKANKQGYTEAYAFVDTSFTGQYQLVLRPMSSQPAQFQQIKSVNVDFGFWQGGVTADEERVLLTQGMEIWPNESVRPNAKLMLFKTDGTSLWEYPMGYDSWGASISGDGAYAAYAQKHSTQPELGLLDGATGSLIWKRPFDLQNFPTGSSFIGHNSNEIRISNTKQYVAVGSGEGDFYLLNRTNGQVIWRKFLHGQVRRTEFSADDQFVYVGSDPWLYKFRVADSTMIWRANISSWPLHYGLRLSPDETMIASIGKSGDLTVVRTADGLRVWSSNQGVIGQWLAFSPDGKYLAAAAFGGTWVYEAATGKPLWRVKGTKAGYFSADNKHLLLFNELYTNDGTRIAMLPEPVGGQFCFINKSGTRIVLASGQMNAPGTGIVFYQGSITTGINEGDPGIAREYSLAQNYPNPFNPSTTIRFSIPAAGHVMLKIFDLLGREVNILLDEEMIPGAHAVRWNAHGVPSGVYVARLEADGHALSRKLILLR